MIAIEHETDLKNFVPNVEAILGLEGLGMILTSTSDSYGFVSRCFYPKLNVSEGSVTGSAHTFLTPIWRKKLGKDVMTAKQISSRGGVIIVRQEEDWVFLSGQVQLFMEGGVFFRVIEGIICPFKADKKHGILFPSPA